MWLLYYYYYFYTYRYLYNIITYNTKPFDRKSIDSLCHIVIVHAEEYRKETNELSVSRSRHLVRVSRRLPNIS